MEWNRLSRLLRYCATAFFVVVCALLIALWVRSYQTADRLHGRIWFPESFLLAAKEGSVTLVVLRWHGAANWWQWEIQSYSVDDEMSFPVGPVDQYESALRFGWITNPIYMVMPSTQTLADGSQVSMWGAATATLRGGGPIVPFWFLVVLCGVLAAVPWFKPAWRFSLRTLLIVITLVALVLGLVVALAK